MKLRLSSNMYLIFFGFLMGSSLAFAENLESQGADASQNSQPRTKTEIPEFSLLKNSRLTTVLNELFSRESSSTTAWSVDVRAFSPEGKGFTVYQLDPTRAVRPASNMKLLTTWSAFHRIPELSDTGSTQYSTAYDMMKTSDNDAAETLLAKIGGPQSIYDTFTQEKLKHTLNMTILDGSGLSYFNRVAASDVIQVLLSVFYSKFYKPFRATLPRAGVDGTLVSRPITSHARVSAKTGTLTENPDVGLSGYANVQGGWFVIFSILGDGVPSVDSARITVDSAVREVANTMRFYK